MENNAQAHEPLIQPACPSQSDFKGTVPVPPDAVRVWRGFRADPTTPTSWGKFLSFLAETMFPVEANWRPAFGLTCYVAGIKSPEADPRTPDEFSLVFYESQGVYDAGLKTVAGRIYPLFPAAKFAPGRGKSGYPNRFQGSFAFDTPYYLFGDAVDWYHGRVSCRLATTLPGRSAEELLETVLPLLSAIQASPPCGLDGLITMLDKSPDGGGYLLLWAHWADGTCAPADFLAGIESVAQDQFVKAEAQAMTVTGGFYDPGVTLSPTLVGDQLLNLRFLRRKLAPENGRVVGGPYAGDQAIG